MDNSVDLSSKEEKIIKALRKNPQLLECFFELSEISENKLDDLQFSDDAEEATVSTIQKTGKEVLENWARKKHQDIRDEYRSMEGHREHEKNSTGRPLWA